MESSLEEMGDRVKEIAQACGKIGRREVASCTLSGKFNQRFFLSGRTEISKDSSEKLTNLD
jgi:hypothetical protein